MTQAREPTGGTRDPMGYSRESIRIIQLLNLPHLGLSFPISKQKSGLNDLSEAFQLQQSIILWIWISPKIKVGKHELNDIV